MKDYNKENLKFLLSVFASVLTAFSLVVLAYYIKDGWWAAPFPLAASIYGVYSLLKKYVPKKEVK